MLIGGGIGGTAGGLRIIVLVLLVQAIRGKNDHALDSQTSLARQQAVGIAAGIATALFILVTITTFALVYREPGSTEVCAFEAVSACCNVGLSAGLITKLSIQSQVVMILAMLLGRIVPLGILLRCIPLVSATPNNTTPSAEPEFSIEERLHLDARS